MTALKQKLAIDFKSAMREGDTVRKNTVQMVRAAVLQYEKDNKVELDDQGVTEVIAKELKKRRDSLPEYEKSGRQDLIDELKREIEILLSYLPSQLSDGELEAIVKDTISEVGATSLKEIGKVMAAVLPKVKGRADGKKVSELVRKYLS